MPPQPANSAIISDGKIWFIQNTTREGPGYFGELLKSWKIPFSICDLEKGQALPEIGKSDAVIVMGGPQSANDRTETMQNLLAWIKALLDRKIPYLGICLGLQTLVKAAGGEVVPSSMKEVGFRHERTAYSCDVTPEGKKDRLLARVPMHFEIFQLHGEMVQLKPQMQVLAKGKWCENQVVKVRDNAYGFQGHLELTTQLLDAWLKEDDDLKTLNASHIKADWKKREHEMHFNCRKVLLNFLKVAGFVEAPNENF